MDGRKFDHGKDRWDLLPIRALEQIVKVLTFGARKYDDNNWQKVPDLEKRYRAALLRHVVADWQGERVDVDSGLPHLACAGCCLLFLLSARVGFDGVPDEFRIPSVMKVPDGSWDKITSALDEPIPYNLSNNDCDEWQARDERPLNDDDVWPGDFDP